MKCEPQSQWLQAIYEISFDDAFEILQSLEPAFALKIEVEAGQYTGFGFFGLSDAVHFKLHFDECII